MFALGLLKEKYFLRPNFGVGRYLTDTDQISVWKILDDCELSFDP